MAKLFLRNEIAFYKSPITGRLSPCRIKSRDLTGKRPNQYSVRVLTTNLGAWVHEKNLLTGFESDLTEEYWNNPENWEDLSYVLPIAELSVDSNLLH